MRCERLCRLPNVYTGAKVKVISFLIRNFRIKRLISISTSGSVPPYGTLKSTIYTFISSCSVRNSPIASIATRRASSFRYPHIPADIKGKATDLFVFLLIFFCIVISFAYECIISYKNFSKNASKKNVGVCKHLFKIITDSV